MSQISSCRVVDKTQADGSFELPLGVADKFFHHQIQVELSATPSSGELTVEVKSPGAQDYSPLDGEFDLADGSLVKTFGPAFVSSFRFTLTNFDADKTVSVTVVSGGI